MAGPFDLKEVETYRRWCDRKLAGYPANVAGLVVEVRDMAALTKAEQEAVLDRARRTNMALVAGQAEHRQDEGKDLIRALGWRFGLENLDSNLCADDDGITPLRVTEQGQRVRYIPYTNQPIRWHTDGYYNALDAQIRGLLLYCVQDAALGGENALVDHELVYLLMRNANPDYVAALMHPEAMTIPPNTSEDGSEIREARSGPVFSVDSRSGALHMRYTMRKRNVVWRDDPVTQEAIAFLENLLEGNSPYIFHHRMTPGQALVCNNVLHDRAGFADDPTAGRKRLLYRARYFDRITGTEPEAPDAGARRD